jgi:hypothetical protein
MSVHVNTRQCISIHFNIRKLSKIFRTDAVQILKLAVSPIGRHHPRSSILPHTDNGPSISSIFGTLSGSPFLSQCQALCDSAWICSIVSNQRPFRLKFIFGNGKIHRVLNQWCFLTACQVTSRPRERFSRYSKWRDTFWTALV